MYYLIKNDYYFETLTIIFRFTYFIIFTNSHCLRRGCFNLCNRALCIRCVTYC